MGFGEATSEAIERVATAIVDAAFKVHKKLGPGLLESVYETCLEYELRRRGFNVGRQRKVPILYDGVRLNADLTLDLIVDNCVIVEIKSVEKMHPVYTAQCLRGESAFGNRIWLLTCPPFASLSRWT